MKTNNFFRTAVLAGAALLAVSCFKDDFEPDTAPGTDGEEVGVSLDYSVASLAAGDAETLSELRTRVIPDDITDNGDILIKNMFIIQFAGKESTSKMLGAPRFLSSTDLSASPLTVPLIETADECYTLFVANVAEGKEYNWNLSTQSTFDDVMKRVKRISKEDDTFETIGVEKTLLMSAVTESVVNSSTILNPVFTRNVARLTLKLTLDNSYMTITSVRLRNVSTSVAYADAALTATGAGSTTPYPADVTVMDYDAVTTGMPTYGTGAASFSWYVPRNQRGVNILSGGYEEKTFYAPTAATYFEIVAVKTVGPDTSTCVFRVYPGANQVNDYNLTPNNHYTIGLTVKDDGKDIYDSRVEKFESRDFSEFGATSNSFILNPAPKGGAAITYDIPVTQVNRYWSGTAEGYGNTPANVIGNSDTWTVSLIWCDLDGLFSTTYITTAISLTNNNTGAVGTGTGPDECFRLSVPAGMPAGNFTLGLKKSGSDIILWSWHFWVTDYNPDKFSRALITPGRYTYPVPGGQVERYADNGTPLWENGGGYAKSVMMDRSLGAVEDYFTAQPTSSKRGFLYYQFGRKDPFPTVTVTPPSSASVERRDEGEKTIKESVNMPYVFYYRANGGSWCAEAKSTGYNWNDPRAGSEKSIYDPCPPGWRMPVDGTWSDFDRKSDGSYINAQNSLRDLAWGYGRGIGSVATPVNGLRYWPGESATAPAEGRIWYPAAGYRNPASGHVGTNGTHGYCWSATPYEEAYARYLYFNSGVVSPPATTYRAAGFSARCISEPLQ